MQTSIWSGSGRSRGIQSLQRIGVVIGPWRSTSLQSNLIEFSAITNQFLATSRSDFLLSAFLPALQQEGHCGPISGKYLLPVDLSQVTWPSPLRPPLTHSLTLSSEWILTAFETLKNLKRSSFHRTMNWRPTQPVDSAEVLTVRSTVQLVTCYKLKQFRRIRLSVG